MIALLALALAVQPVADAERAYAAMAARVGHYTAMRATATADAVMFEPGMVRAQDWLKGRADPPQPFRWWPDRTLTACDATAAFSSGNAIDPDGVQGHFRTIWIRSAAGWRWVLEDGAPLRTRPVAAQPLKAETASCAAGARAALWWLTVPSRHAQADTVLNGMAARAFAKPLILSGASEDATLTWQMRGDAVTGRRILLVWVWNGTAHDLAVARAAVP